MRRALLVLAAVLALAAPAAAQERGNVLRVGWAQDPSTLNPFVGLDEENFSIWTINWDTLVNLDPQTLEPAPGIARSWDVADGGRSVTFKLDPEAKWSDGEPITARDVKWSLETLGSEGAIFTGYTTNVKAIETPDPHTVVIRGKKPDTRFVGGLAIYILPEHVWGKVPVKELTGNYKPKLPLVGSGPYVATEFDRGRIVRMERNPEFRGEPGAFEQLQYVKYGNQDATERALTLGEVDYVREVSAAGFERLGEQPNVDTRRSPSASYTQLAFNSCEGCPNANPAVQDPVVRQAIAFGIDRQKLQAIATRGTSFVANGIIPSFYRSFYTEPEQTYAYDVEEANRLLDEAGWQRGGDGVRAKDGRELRFDLYVRSESPFTTQMGKLIAEMGEDFGVRFDVQVVSTDKLTDLTLNEEDGEPAPDFDLFIWGWGGDAYDPSFLLSILTTQAIEDGLSDAYYSNPEYDRRFEEQATIFDVEERKAMIADMVNMAQEDLPYLVLTEDPRLEAYRTDRLAKIDPVCPAETGGLTCDQISYDGVLALRPFTAATGGGGGGGSPTGSTGLGLVIGLGLGFAAGAVLMGRRRRGGAEPLELPE